MGRDRYPHRLSAAHASPCSSPCQLAERRAYWMETKINTRLERLLSQALFYRRHHKMINMHATFARITSIQGKDWVQNLSNGRRETKKKDVPGGKWELVLGVYSVSSLWTKAGLTNKLVAGPGLGSGATQLCSIFFLQGLWLSLWAWISP